MPASHFAECFAKSAFTESAFAQSATPRGTLSKTFSKWVVPHIKRMTAAVIIIHCTTCIGCKDYNEAILKV
jgi:hypothetical protein